VGGWLADKIGGLWTLDIVFVIAIVGIVGLMQAPPLLATTLLFMLCFAALGAGNGATFQLVPLRWPATTAVAGGMIGEIGALGGSILPNLLGQSKQYTGSYSTGLLVYAGIATFVFLVMLAFARVWTRKWVGKGGRAIVAIPVSEGIAAD
jgi:NNP family nitrate/nitrite transporter-like MFS transporter